MRAGLRPPTPPKPTPQACARPSTSRSAPAAARTRSGDYGYLVSTTVFLVDGIASAVVRDDVTCGQIWREIKGLVTAAASARLFAPLPSNRCQWCPYFGNGCILPEGTVTPVGLLLPTTGEVFLYGITGKVTSD